MPNATSTARVAILDDYQGVARAIADWSAVEAVAEVAAFTDHLHDEAAVADRLRGFDVMVAMRERTPFPRSLLQRLPDLKLLVTTGLNNRSFDLDAAAVRGIVVSGTDLVSTSTVEAAWGLILAVARDICGEDRRTRAGEWQRFLPLNLAGSTLGVIGLGRLGSQVAAVGRAFGMSVLAWSPHLPADRAAAVGAERAEFDDVFERSDVVTVHVPLSEASTGLIGAEQLRRLGPNGYLINTSCGPIVDADALLAALHAGSIAGAGPDVYDVEPVPPGHPLLTAPRTVLSPHVGFVSRRSYAVAYAGAVEDILAWLDGQPVRVLNDRKSAR